jgi:hypothetical protein
LEAVSDSRRVETAQEANGRVPARDKVLGLGGERERLCFLGHWNAVTHG